MPIAEPPPSLQPSGPRATLMRTELQESPIAQLRPASTQNYSSSSSRSDNLLDIPVNATGIPQRPTPLLPNAQLPLPPPDPSMEAVTDELDEAGLTETYAEYSPKKCNLL